MDDRCATAHRLDRGHSEPLIEGREEERDGSFIETSQHRIRYGAEKAKRPLVSQGSGFARKIDIAPTQSARDGQWNAPALSRREKTVGGDQCSQIFARL